MSPIAITANGNGVKANGVSRGHLDSMSSPMLHRSLHQDPQEVIGGKGNYLELANGEKVLDATVGPAVSCLGHGNERVKEAVMKQMDAISYCTTSFFSTRAAEDLAEELIASTHGKMAKAFIVSSGSEANEAAMKLARQYFREIGQPQRVRFISRRESYHGNTLGALALGGHVGRRAVYEPILMDKVSRVSPCNSYRFMEEGEQIEGYVKRLAAELDAEFRKFEPNTICAFVAEPVVGAALGCVPSIPGYFQAMKAVCDRHGALLIFDEVMCGMGRTGTLHAWEQEGVVPDIQTIGKGLGGGYMAVAGLLIHPRVIEGLSKGTGAFMHGHTYQGHPVACAAALEVQRIVRENNLCKNAKKMGGLLERSLRARLDGHPNVGNIRGRGLFWGIEFVEDKMTKKAFDPSKMVAWKVHDHAINPPYSISLYPGNGTVDGKEGDHIIISPAYNITSSDVGKIVDLTASAIESFFEQNRL